MRTLGAAHLRQQVSAALVRLDRRDRVRGVGLQPAWSGCVVRDQRTGRLTASQGGRVRAHVATYAIGMRTRWRSAPAPVHRLPPPASPWRLHGRCQQQGRASSLSRRSRPWRRGWCTTCCHRSSSCHPEEAPEVGEAARGSRSRGDAGRELRSCAGGMGCKAQPPRAPSPTTNRLAKHQLAM